MRLTRLEQIIELALPQYAHSHPGTPSPPYFDQAVSGAQRRSLSISPDDDNHSHTEDQDPGGGGGTFESGRWYGDSVSGSVAPGSVIEQVALNFLLELSG